MVVNLTIGALLAQGIDQLGQAKGPGPSPADYAGRSLDAELLLAHALSMNRTHLKTHPENVPSPESVGGSTCSVPG